MPEVGVQKTESLHTATLYNQNFFIRAAHQPSAIDHEIRALSETSKNISGRKLVRLAAILGIGASAAAVLVHTIVTFLHTGALALASLSGLDFDVFPEEVSGAFNKISSPNAGSGSFARTNASAVNDTVGFNETTIVSDEKGGAPPQEVESIDSTAYDYYDKMSCAELKNVMESMESTKINLVSFNAFGSNDKKIERIEGSLEIAETVRLGKVLGGDNTCIF